MAFRVMTILMAAGLLLVCPACGGDEPEVEPIEAGRNPDGPTGESTAIRPGESVEPAPAVETPESMGIEAHAIFLSSLTKVTELMEEGLDPADLQAKARALKEEAVLKLVAIGRKREEMSEADRANHDRALRRATFGTAKELYGRFSTAHAEIMKADRELANEIAEFNVLGQYAIFELLKKQLPEEAKRLGIE